MLSANTAQEARESGWLRWLLSHTASRVELAGIFAVLGEPLQSRHRGAILVEEHHQVDQLPRGAARRGLLQCGARCGEGGASNTKRRREPCSAVDAAILVSLEGHSRLQISGARDDSAGAIG